MKIDIPETLEEWNARGADCMPGLIGLRFLKVEADEVVGEFDAGRSVYSWNGFLHAGSVVTLADTCCGYGALKALPEGANGFTTVDLTSSFVGTLLEGTVRCAATPLHLGRTTQLWEAKVFAAATEKPMAHFRCTQLVLWPR